MTQPIQPGDEREWKESLEPFAQHYGAMRTMLSELPQPDLEALRAACDKATSTNCWWATYHAAQYLKREADCELYDRKRAAQTTEGDILKAEKP